MVFSRKTINNATNHLSPQFTEIIVKRPRHMALEIQILAKNRNMNILGLMGSYLSLSQ
jgi:hypothetical protein